MRKDVLWAGCFGGRINILRKTDTQFRLRALRMGIDVVCGRLASRVLIFIPLLTFCKTNKMATLVFLNLCSHFIYVPRKGAFVL